MANQRLLMPTFVAMADTLVDDFDLIDLLSLLAERCVEIFDISAAGIMLVEHPAQLRVVASSSDATRDLELFELQSREGPCLDSYRTGRPVVQQRLSLADQWPVFGPEAMRRGFRSALAIPMRLRGEVIGALNLFSAHETDLAADDLAAVQALADVATIAIVQYRAISNAVVLSEQLAGALHSRVVIEQAKGVLAERSGVDVDVAFVAMRTLARRGGLRLLDVANGVIAGTIEVPIAP